MAISVVFPAGTTVVTLDPLYQWDIGHTLEIRVDSSSPQIEVHFAYSGLSEAMVGTSSLEKGVVRVSIPDICFEQSETINVWVYEINSVGGKTVRTIVIPIIPRTRPPREAMEV